MARGRSVYVKMPSVNKMLKDRGICPNGEVQLAVADAVAYYNIDYVPYLTGTLAESPIVNGIVEDGGQSVRYRAYAENGYNYAGYQYYLEDWHPDAQFSNQNGLRGSHWDKRMKADHIKDIEKYVQDVLDKGGK